MQLDQEARFASCHGFGHQWHHEPMVGIDGDTLGWAKPFGASTACIGFPSTCGMCGCERIGWILRSGERLPYRYRYPDGYQRHGDDRVELHEWRRTFVNAVMPDFLAKPKRAGRHHTLKVVA